jgi:hypothetical protein
MKDEKYYRELDMEESASRLAAFRRESNELNEVQSEVLGDLISAILARRKTERFSDQDLLKFLGNPDRRDTWNGDTVWAYKWRALHGSAPYTSETPLVLRDAIVVGILRKGEVL